MTVDPDSPDCQRALAVLDHALSDALGNGTKKFEALTAIFELGPDLRPVCRRAGIDPLHYRCEILNRLTRQVADRLKQ
jgi:hypothetical protein